MSLSLTNRRYLAILGCAGSVLSTAGCSDPGNPGPDGPDGGDERLPALTLTTFNAGLAPGLSPLVAERGARVIETVARDAELTTATDETAIHVLCAQEFWSEEQWSALTSATASTRSSRSA